MCVNMESQQVYPPRREAADGMCKKLEGCDFQLLLRQILESNRVRVQQVDVRTTLLEAVPVGNHFSKAKSNVLLRRPSIHAGTAVFVDADLAYKGPDEKRVRAFNGLCRKGWRRITPHPLRGDINRVLCSALDIIDSPLTEQVYLALETAAGDDSRAKGNDFEEMFKPFGHSLSPSTAKQAYADTFRKDLASQVAIVVSRRRSPNSVLICGRSGAGKGLLMLAAAHLLYAKEKIDRAIVISSGRIASGCLFPAEVDGIFTEVVTKALRRKCLLLIRDVDVCMTGSEAVKALLCEAMDGGLRFLATVRSENATALLAQDEPIVRRIVSIRVPTPSAKHVKEALIQIAHESHARVQPAAIESIVSLSRRYGEAICEPAWSVGMLSSAITQAQWHGSPQVDPDTVYSVLKSEWPQL